MKKIHFWFAILLMMVLCTLIYSNHFRNEFHFDDSHSIQNNPYIRNIHNVPLFFKDGSTISVLPANQAYRPVVVTSLAFDYWVGMGYNLFYFHLSTFILFLLQGLLMVLFIIKLFNLAAPADRYRNTVIALIAVTFFMLHPAIAETINYIIARADLQSTLAVILAFVLYLRNGWCRKYYIYLVPIIIGALAKPPAIMFAPLLFVYVLMFEQKLSLYDIFKKAFFKQLLIVVKQTLPTIICSIFMYWLQGRLTPVTWEAGGTSKGLYLITQPFVITHYFQMFFVPNALSADTDWQLLTDILDWRFFTGMLFILVMVMTMFVTSQRALLRPISFGIAWFFLALLPTSVVPLGEVLNDHRMFFPFVGLCISTSWTIGLLVKSADPWFAKNVPGYKFAFTFLACLILISYAYATRIRNEVWHTEESLWYDVTLKSPGNGRGLMNYALTKMAIGDYATAELYYLKALKLNPTYATLHINMGVLKAATGHDAEADDWFKKGMIYGPNTPDAYAYYGRFLNSRRRYAEAETMLSKTLSLSPADIFARSVLMDVYQNTNNWPKLKELATSTLQLSPGNTEAQNYLTVAIGKKDKLQVVADAVKKAPTAEKYLELSLTYYNAGRFDDCVAACKQALKIKSDYAEAYNNMGSAYNLLKQYDKAIEALKRAIALKPGFNLAINNLRQAKALSGKTINEHAPQATFTTEQPKTAEEYLNLSLSFFNSGEYQKCVDAGYKAIALKPGYDLAYNNICAAYNKMGLWDKAINAGEKGLKFNPTNQLLKNNLHEAYGHKK